MVLTLFFLYDKQVFGTLLIMKITPKWLDVALGDLFSVEISSRARLIVLVSTSLIQLLRSQSHSILIIGT